MGRDYRRHTGGFMEDARSRTQSPDATHDARRRFLGWLAASPLLAAASGGTLATLLGTASRDAFAQSYDALRAAGALAGDVITSPDQALNVFDFEPAAKQALEGAPAHFGYLASGVDADATLRANRDGFAHYNIRVRRLIDTRNIDTSVEIFGERWASPIALAPVSSQGAFHAEGELAVARAARKRKHQMILSTVGNSSIEDVARDHGSPVWYMLYPTDDWNVARALVKRAEGAGAPAIVLTVDRQGGRNTETLFRVRRGDTRPCAACHEPGSFANEVRRKPMFAGLDLSRVTNLYGTGMTWEYVDRLRDAVKGRLVLKGIMTHEDAREALRHGVDAIIVSNHGGRAEESGQATIDVLPEIVEAVGGRMPVLIDGGFRRGTDVIKALALGAKAICIGRPYCWGLAAFGEPGVDRVLQIMQAEFQTIMRQVGATTIAQITRQNVSRA
jgi:isopentenyl diphosphate isomerase/L-lactate dehydrogenase-like FMN-dependent dehydrogenase